MDVSTSAWSPLADPMIESRSWPPVLRLLLLLLLLLYGRGGAAALLAIARTTCCAKRRSWIVTCAGRAGSGSGAQLAVG